MSLESLQEHNCHLSSLDSHVFPDLVKIYMGHHVLSHRHGVVQIENCMPPPAGDEDSFPGVLDELGQFNLLVVLLLSNAREDLGEVIDGLVLIVLSAEPLALDNGFRQVLFEEDPTLVPNQGSIPGRSAKRVNMYSRT